MRNEIYEIIQKNSSISFDDIWNKLVKTYPEITKGNLAQNIRSLVGEYKIIDVSRHLYDPAQLIKSQGFVHWNANQVCWIEKTDKTNEYGISFNGDAKLLTVANKKDALYGSEVEGFLIENPETLKTSFYITERINMKPIKLFAILDTTDNPTWQVINSNGGLTINAEYFPASSYQHGDIVLVDSLDFTKHSLYGHISDKGIESRIIQTVSNIVQAPTLENTMLLDKISMDTIFLDKPFYTIDSIYTKDIDDAIWCEQNPDQSFKLYVAIADVSSFVKPDSELDIHARKTATSFYFLNNTVHMLSRELAERFCSLNVAENRGSLVCSMDISSTGEIKDVVFSHNTIMSNARLTYDDVNLLLEGKKTNDSFVANIVEYEDNKPKAFIEKYTKNEKIEESLNALLNLTTVLFKEYKPDYWFVTSPQIEVNENGKIKFLFIEERDTSKSQLMVECAMLCANKSAAKFLEKNNVDASALFRNQPAPLEPFERPKPAQYSEVSSGHWGLKAEHYTHYTSPIRRFCDLIVHRMIKDIIDNKSTYEPSELAIIADEINAQQYKNKVCSNRESNLLINQYISSLVETGQLNNKFKVVDYSENGVVFRNSQLIDLYIPSFKLDRKFSKLIEELNAQNLNPNEKKENLEIINENFLFKCFLDSYNWINDYKQIGFKMYPRDSDDAKLANERGNEKLLHPN